MHQRRPVALGIHRSPDRLMTRSCFARADLRIIEENIVFSRYRLELLFQQSRCFTGAVERGLMLLEPLFPLRPQVTLFDKNFLLFANRFSLNKFLAGVTNS